MRSVCHDPERLTRGELPWKRRGLTSSWPNSRRRVRLSWRERMLGPGRDAHVPAFGRGEIRWRRSTRRRPRATSMMRQVANHTRALWSLCLLGRTNGARWNHPKPTRACRLSHPQRSAIGKDAYGPCPSCGKRTRPRFPQARWTAHRTRRPQRPTGRAGDGTKTKEQRTETGYNDALVSRRLTRLTSRASLRSDHDRWNE